MAKRCTVCDHFLFLTFMSVAAQKLNGKLCQYSVTAIVLFQKTAYNLPLLTSKNDEHYFYLNICSSHFLLFPLKPQLLYFYCALSLTYLFLYRRIEFMAISFT